MMQFDFTFLAEVPLARHAVRYRGRETPLSPRLVCAGGGRPHDAPPRLLEREVWSVRDGWAALEVLVVENVELPPLGGGPR